ncbi:hypothetical protein HNR40_010780 [Nonomuraea endophytica]|uniref:Uncharacterized protein n=1 Tax=Nonomuraea endophytica TaxID=714136 RepID=A0A7W8AHM3_9ACTN|nr:hypothetical protein [Nonomuraea endophytica]
MTGTGAHANVSANARARTNSIAVLSYRAISQLS